MHSSKKAGQDLACCFGTLGNAKWGTSHDLKRKLDAVIELGRTWRPANAKEIGYLRSCLLELSSYETCDVVKTMKSAGFMSEEHIHDLLDTVKMRSHLAPLVQALARLIPRFKKWL